jgi:hypothetical protein
VSRRSNVGFGGKLEVLDELVVLVLVVVAVLVEAVVVVVVEEV